MVLALLEAGAPINAQDHRGNTPVHVAVRMGRLVILRNLLDRGVSRSIRNLKKRNPENLASIARAPHSIAALRILQGLRKTDTAGYLFSEVGDNINTNFGFLPHSTAPKALPKTNTSSLDETSTMVHKELLAFPSGRLEKEKLL